MKEAKPISTLIGAAIPDGIDTAATEQTAGKPQHGRTRRKTEWEKMCPPLYRDHNPELLPDAAKIHLNALRAWDPSKGRGLLLVGESRTGKTRVAWRVLRKHFINSGTRFVHHDMLSWPLLAARAYAGDPSTDKAIESLTATPILFIDDAFKQKLTDWQECFILGILERRARELKPILMTMNSTAKQIKDRMSDAGREDRFMPLIERMEEFNDILVFRNK